MSPGVFALAFNRDALTRLKLRFDQFRVAPDMPVPLSRRQMARPHKLPRSHLAKGQFGLLRIIVRL